MPESSSRPHDRPLRIVFLGTPAIAVPTLELLFAQEPERIEIAAVVTQPDRPAGRGGKTFAPPVKEAALRLGIPVLQPPSLRKTEAVESLRSLAPDALVVFAYGQILRKRVLDIPRLGCLNVHPSLLPRLRGAVPVNGAILEGLTETGVTVMRMDEGMDTGPILRQIREPIRPDDDSVTLGERLSKISAELLVSTLFDYAEGKAQPVPQSSEGATYTKLLAREDGQIDWRQSAEAIERRIRAFRPWPGTFSQWEGKLLKILAARVVANVPENARPGQVIGLGERSDPNGRALLIATGDGVLGITSLQLEGKRAMSAGELAAGYSRIVGATLGQATGGETAE